MNLPGNGKPRRYQVSYSGVIAKVLNELRYDAFLKGRLQDFDGAWRTILERLRNDPWNFGEFIRPFASLKMKMHVASVSPITVRFGIHEDMPLVVIAKVIFINPS